AVVWIARRPRCVDSLGAGRDDPDARERRRGGRRGWRRQCGPGLSGTAGGGVDGDANADLLFGAPWAADSYAGEAFLQLGFVSGVVAASGLPTFRGTSGEYLGSNVAIVPDWTGDGRDEVALTAPYHTDAAGDIDGAVY